MKTLELNQMEKINGTSAWGCAGFGLGAWGLAAGVMAISGPVGWLAYSAFMAGAMSTGFSLGDCVMGMM